TDGTRRKGDADYIKGFAITSTSILFAPGCSSPKSPWIPMPGAVTAQYLKAPGKRNIWLRADWLLGEWGLPRIVRSDENALPNAWNIAAARKVPSPTGKPWSGAGSCEKNPFKQALLAQIPQRRGD